MIRKSIFLLTVLVLLMIVNQSLSAQEEVFVVDKLFYVELCGPSVVMSANFDSRFKSNSRVGFGYRLGVGYGAEKFENKLGDILKDDILNNDIQNNEKLSDFYLAYYFAGIPLIQAATHIIMCPAADDVKKSFFSVPIGVNYIFGRPRRISTFEVGAGVTFFSRKVLLYNWELEKSGYMTGYLSFMYRLMPVNGGLSFRIGITPIIGTAGDLFPTGAISLGYAF